MRTLRNMSSSVAMLLLATTGVDAKEKPPPPPKVPLEEQASIALTKVAQQLPAGVKWLDRRAGDGCSTVESAWGDGKAKLVDLDAFGPIFALEVSTAGLKIPALNRANLFSAPVDSNISADYEVGALIHELNIATCVWNSGGQAVVTTTAKMAVEWQLFSTGDGRVVDNQKTDVNLTRLRYADSINQIIEDLFISNSKKFISSPTFQQFALHRPRRIEAGPSEPASTIAAIGARSRYPSLGEAAGAVVLISTGAGFGSGVLVSTEGFVLTNAHVVKGSQSVTVRWSDGVERDGRVVRLHDRRDVALIKTDAREREPLPLRDTAVQVGETVFAIGSPLDKLLQGTVTRGIVSAKRILDGYSFIQSDVAVTHGNSGGPLLDTDGRVVGLADLGITPNDVPLGLNLFIPIKDALEFVKLEVAGSSQTAGAGNAIPAQIPALQ